MIRDKAGKEIVLAPVRANVGIRAAYRLDVNEYNGLASVQLIVEHFEAT